MKSETIDLLHLKEIINILWGENNELIKNKLFEKMKEIFPDCYDSNKTESWGNRHEWYTHFIKPTKVGEIHTWETNGSGFDRFVGGNVHDGSYGIAKATRDLLRDLNHDFKIVYKETATENSKTVSPRESMIENIKTLVAEIDIGEKKKKIRDYYQSKNLHYSEIEEACERLFDNDTMDSFVYLIFLLIVVSIFQGDSCKVKNLYDQDSIDIILKIKKEKRYSIKENLKMQAIDSLFDEYYQGKYIVYMQRPSYDHLYEKGTLDLTVDRFSNYSYANLKLEDKLIAMRTDEEIKLKKEYEGETILNQKDKMVYSIMTGVNGTVGLMIFKYNRFNYQGMLVRTGFFISSYPGRGTPYVQKMIISTKEIKDVRIIEGLLKVDSGNIILEKESLDLFIQKYESAKWMEEFKRKILPFIRNHLKVCYSFTPEELYHYSLANIDEVDKVEIIELLKSYALNNSIIECKHLERTNRMITEYDKRHKNLELQSGDD